MSASTSVQEYHFFFRSKECKLAEEVYLQSCLQVFNSRNRATMPCECASQLCDIDFHLPLVQQVIGTFTSTSNISWSFVLDTLNIVFMCNVMWHTFPGWMWLLILCICTRCFHSSSCIWYLNKFYFPNSSSKFPCASCFTHACVNFFVKIQGGRILRIFFTSFLPLALTLRKKLFLLLLDWHLEKNYFLDLSFETPFFISSNKSPKNTLELH